jgi:hypothetical protein
LERHHQAALAIGARLLLLLLLLLLLWFRARADNLQVSIGATRDGFAG